MLGLRGGNKALDGSAVSWKAFALLGAFCFCFFLISRRQMGSGISLFNKGAGAQPLLQTLGVLRESEESRFSGVSVQMSLGAILVVSFSPACSLMGEV